MNIQGQVWKFGDDVDTDVIIPAVYLVTSDPGTLALHAMEPVDPEFHKKVNKGDILVAGRNFGCGSSREHAPLALKGLGLGGIIAASYARIFFRNAVNIALPVFECPEAAEALTTGDRIRIDNNEIISLNSGLRFPFRPLPAFMEEIYRRGGLMAYVKAGGGKWDESK